MSVVPFSLMRLEQKEDATHCEQGYRFLVPLFNSTLLWVFKTVLHSLAPISTFINYIVTVHRAELEQLLWGTQLFRRGEAVEKCYLPWLLKHKLFDSNSFYHARLFLNLIYRSNIYLKTSCNNCLTWPYLFMWFAIDMIPQNKPQAEHHWNVVNTPGASN